MLHGQTDHIVLLLRSPFRCMDIAMLAAIYFIECANEAGSCIDPSLLMLLVAGYTYHRPRICSKILHNNQLLFQ